ncbi:hypothetical protein [Lachnoclostridium phytofermentans]|uniref:Lipoprotein n=1 Tax=Lachnoclostridium phytofermentans (strain ATCC 700394 / DSM 18823 / ISDg) TaxID=357809 RepID=A9KT86_LACP7|nr:hypothetical protein [Lachnoclostridium phytofermentans]ABX43716.1 hypothetical protein Cphy_3363 [Lachnoclostridium phytofermentans ISDg]
MSSRKLIMLCILTTILCSGCQATQGPNNSSISTSSELTPDVTISVTGAPDITETPEATPIAEDILITEEDAISLIQGQINTRKYSISLLTENITINSKNYYSFIATKNLTALEPAILVNKNTGELSCLTSDGKHTPFSSFSISPVKEDTETNWNGTFIRKDLRGVTTSTVTLIQNDSTSFEFHILARNSLGVNRLSGIGYIDGTTAKHFTNDEISLTFTLDNNYLTLTDNDFFTENWNSIAGSYVLDKDVNEDLTIVEEDAIQMIRSLSTLQTGLSAEINEYQILSDNTKLIIKDRICYSFGTYAKLENKDILVTNFYVTLDGDAIYTYNSIKNTYECIYGK